ncbi:glycosyltransferase family 4 protein [Paenibacillus allorhizosphaerae]|uniref:glycosyltransferase family 4 protein n=1 Tax=Paenibacillus allorhizosphaerae TaxID=2849866 RepID=UPI001E627AEE|nr:glycosyltransferase family 4 protein [Paenibacillus allorhizosphaerae]
MLLSPHGIGIGTLAQALRAHGVDATACSYSRDVYSYLSDICLKLNEHPYKEREAIRKAFFHEAMNKYDIFHFHFGETFFTDKSDLKLLKDRGKKLIVHHNGSDARLLSVARSFHNPYVLVKQNWPEERVHANMRLLSAYIGHAIINDNELMPYVKPYYQHIHVVPYAINVRPIVPHYPSPEAKPLIVHAPSHREIKGTEYVLAAIDRLKRKGYPFRFKLLENLPHHQVVHLYKQAAIVIDQLRIGTYANLSIEAMAMGKPVICYIRDDLRGTFPRGLPIVSANPDTIFEVLKDLLNRPSDWRKLGEEGRSYVEQTHSYEKVAQKLIPIYEQL